MRFYTVYKEDEFDCKGRKEIAHRRNVQDAVEIALKTVEAAAEYERKAGYEVTIAMTGCDQCKWTIDLYDDGELVWKQILVWIEEKELL